MKFLRLLELRKQQEQQAQTALSHALREMTEEATRLGDLHEEHLRVEKLSGCRDCFQIEQLRQRACYLDKLNKMIRAQWKRLEDRKDNVQNVRLNWDKCRVEKEKMEKLVEKREQMQRAREKALAQTNLDDIGRLLVLRGNQ